MGARVVGCVVAATTMVAAACSGPSGGEVPSGGASGPGFPATVVADCRGAKVTLRSAPRRIVTSNASALELLFWLGAGDRVIGTGFPPGKGTLPPQFAEAAAKVPVLSDTVIAKEELLGSGADLYIDTFAAPDAGGGAPVGVPTEREFAAAGITHLSLLSTACAARSSGQRRDLADVEADIARLGAVTGTSAKANELVEAMRHKVNAVRDAVAGVAEDKRPSYFFFDFDASTKQPMALCGKQIGNAIFTLAGARNVYADCDADFRQVSWEDVVAKNPDWIQLGVRDRGDDKATSAAFDQAEQFLRQYPATSGLAAVRQDNFVRITSQLTAIAGVRDADTVRAIAASLYPSLVRGEG